MAWWFLVAPVKLRSPDLTRAAPRRPRISGGEDFSINRVRLRSNGTLEWQRKKLPAEELAGDGIQVAALSGGRRRSGGAVKRMKNYRTRGVFIDPARRFMCRI
jgi:hypothetical protein